MRKILCAFVSLVLVISSCRREWVPPGLDGEPLPGPLEDLEERQHEVALALSGGGGGKFWKGIYHPDSANYGAYKLLIHFKSTNFVDVYSDDEAFYFNKADKDADRDVLYEVIPGIRDRVVFKTYCVFHEFFDTKRGEFEFYFSSDLDVAEDSVVLSSFTDGIARGTRLKLVPSSLKYLDTLRFERGYHNHNLRAFGKLYINTLTYLSRGVEIPMRFNPGARTLTFSSEILNAKDKYETFTYPYTLFLQVKGSERHRGAFTSSRSP